MQKISCDYTFFDYEIKNVILKYVTHSVRVAIVRYVRFTTSFVSFLSPPKAEDVEGTIVLILQAW